MSAFSELLSEEMRVNDISAMKISALTKISRSTITKFLSGQKLPSQEELSRIVSFIPITLEDQHRLMTELDNIRFGSSVCSQLDGLFKKMSFRPSAFHDHSPASADITDEGDIILLQSRSEMQKYIKSYIERETENPNTAVYSNITAESGSIQQEILRILSNAGKGWDFNLCISLKKSSSELGFENLSALFDWAPFVLSKCNIYYEYVTEKTSVMPFGYVHFIILSKTVILMNEDFTNALVITKPDVVENLRRSARERITVMKSLVKRCTTIFDMFEKIKRAHSKYSGYTYLQYFPCIVPYLEYAHYEEIANTDIQQVRDILPDLYEYYQSRKKGFNRGVFTSAGLMEFAKTGIIPEIPREYASPVSPEVRKYALTQILREMQNGSDFRIFNDNFVTLPSNIVIDLIAESQLTFMWLEHSDCGFAGQVSSVTNEIYLLQEADKFFDTLFESRYLYTKEQTADIIERCIAEIK